MGCIELICANVESYVTGGLGEFFQAYAVIASK
jgi:hypothetical protein